MGIKQSGADTFVMNQIALLMKSLRIVCTGIILISSIFIYAQSEIELRTDGIVVPRTTSAAVVSPIKGMLIYDTDIDGFKYYDGTDWLNIGGGTGGSVAWSDITGKPAGFADGTDHINDADANATNELQTISKSGSTVTLSNSGGSFSIDDADANASNELQTISKSGSTVTLSDGGGSFSIDDADANASNELQDLSLSNDIIRLSNSSPTIPISNISPWTISGDDATKKTGNVIVGSALSPKEKLEVVGAINLSGDASSNNPDAGTIRWNSSTVDFEGYDGVHWESLTGHPGPIAPPEYEIGDFEDQGVVFWISPDEKTVKFVYIAKIAYDSWADPSNIDVVGAESNLDGLQNSLDIINDSNISSSAAQNCMNLEAGGHSDWYMPAINELEALWAVRETVNDTIQANLGDTVFSSGDPTYILNWAWSSTESGSSSALYLNGLGERDFNFKSINAYQVRAIRTVTFP